MTHHYRSKDQCAVLHTSKETSQTRCCFMRAEDMLFCKYMKNGKFVRWLHVCDDCVQKLKEQNKFHEEIKEEEKIYIITGNIVD
jgi:hypothetical protein